MRGPAARAPRLYREPRRDDRRARRSTRSVPALERVRAGVAAGAHAAGYLAYEAGHAFDPKLAASARQGDGPLLCFGLFDGFETPDLGDAAARRPTAPSSGAPRPRIAQARL